MLIDFLIYLFPFYVKQKIQIPCKSRILNKRFAAYSHYWWEQSAYYIELNTSTVCSKFLQLGSHHVMSLPSKVYVRRAQTHTSNRRLQLIPLCKHTKGYIAKVHFTLKCVPGGCQQYCHSRIETEYLTWEAQMI